QPGKTHQQNNKRKDAPEQVWRTERQTTGF
ncbi:unnamed protein product, partial [marine sediment metagenome]